MIKLEDLRRGARVKGIDPHHLVTVADGQVGTQLLYRESEAALEIAQAGRVWSFDGNGDLLRLTSEAYRIHLAYLFDPVLAVHTSLIEPLPHQITAVYGEMLTRQPLRFLLADDRAPARPLWLGCSSKNWLCGATYSAA